jgi:hypothetical protein
MKKDLGEGLGCAVIIIAIGICLFLSHLPWIK